MVDPSWEVASPFFLASKSFAQSAQAVEPSHEQGANSSTMETGEAQMASADFTSPTLKPSTNWFTGVTARRAPGRNTPRDRMTKDGIHRE